MDAREAQMYATLLKGRQDIKAAYYDNLRNLHQTKAPWEVFERLFDEADAVLKELDKRIEAHPLHRK